MEDISPQHSVSQEILNYLKSQENVGEYSLEDLLEIERQLNKEEMQQILSELIGRIEERARMKEEHEEKLKAHNQYPLFNFSEIIEDFYIDDDLYEQLTFRETLIIGKLGQGKEPPTPVGGLCLDVQTAKGLEPLERKFIEPTFVDKLEIPTDDEYWAGNCGLINRKKLSPDEVKYLREIEVKKRRKNTKFLVHLNSQFCCECKNAGSRMTSWVDRNFHTLEEKRKEFIVVNQKLNEKSLFVALQQGKYYVKHRSNLEKLQTRHFYGIKKMKDFLSEGASFILMRYLALHKYRGTFELSGMYINGDLCRNIYFCDGPMGGIVNGEKVDLCKIFRKVIEECGIEHYSCTVLTLHGQIIKHEWKDCNYVLYLNPLSVVKNAKPLGNDYVILKNNWQDDLQLFSKYLDEKTKCSMKLKSYLLDHPEVHDLISDYVQMILMLKPADILEYTIKYFKNYAPFLFPRNEYIETQYEYEEEEENIVI